MADKKFLTTHTMLDWQYFQILGELQELQRHDSDPTCPCRLSDDLGENCLAKHSLGLSVIAAETAAMETDKKNATMLWELSADAKDKHMKIKGFLCHQNDGPEFGEWSRQWRKKIEPIYYHQSCKVGKLKDGEEDGTTEKLAIPAYVEDSPATPQIKKQITAADIAELFDSDPHLKISGTCSEKEGCSIKVTGKVETTEQTTAANLPSAIDSVIKSMEKKQAKKASPLTYAIGSTSLKRYELRFEILDAKELIPSNDPITFEVNSNYPQELQPRIRARAANKSQVISIASNLDSSALMDEFHSLEKGSPIVNERGVVLSGNGRVMGILHAISEFPQSYALYKANLESKAADYGLKVGKVENPVLVRKLVSKVDEKSFVEEANASTTIQSSGIEVARSDAQKITPAMLNNLGVSESQTIEDALRSSTNAQFVASFLSKLTANERAAISDAKGNLNQDGIRRIVLAIFVNVFSGDSGLSLAARYSETTESTVKNVFNGIIASLGKLAQSENLIKDGQRPAGLAISEDLSKVVIVYSDLKKQDGMTIEKYIHQASMLERELNPFQEHLLKEIDNRARSGKKIAALLKNYADIVIAQPPPSQGAFMAIEPLTKEEALAEAIRRSNQPTLEDIVSQLFDTGQSLFVGAGQGRLMDSDYDWLAKKLSCPMSKKDLSNILAWKPLREFVSWAIGLKKKVDLCPIGMTSGVYQIVIYDTVSSAQSSQRAEQVPGLMRVYTPYKELVYTVVLPENKAQELAWEPREVVDERRGEKGEQAAMFDSDPVKANLKRSIHDELKAIKDYEDRAAGADEKTAELYKEIRKDELTHYDAFTKRLAELKGTALNDNSMYRSDPVEGGQSDVSIPLVCGRQPVEGHIRKAIENAEEVD